MKPLEGIRIVSLAINLPGPIAAARLNQFGAEVLKIEPPSGDPLGIYNRAYYDRLIRGDLARIPSTACQQIIMLDLKNVADRARLDTELAASDLLLTAQRPSALKRLGLEWPVLHEQFPRLCHVALIGFPPPHDDVPTHDLMLQAVHGLLDPPHMPKTLVADLGAAEQVVSAALALLLARERTGQSGYAQVSIAEAGEWFALPVRYRLTIDGALSGALPSYGLYRTRDGYVALAALEPHFLERLAEGLALAKITRENLEHAFLSRTAQEWETWARERDIPLAAVRPCEDQAHSS